MGRVLREAISSALVDDCMWTKDWESEPLPQTLLSADAPKPTPIPTETLSTNVKRKRQRSKKSKSKTKTQELVETGSGSSTLSSYGGISEHKLAERMKRFAKNARNGPQATAAPDMVSTTTMEMGKYDIDDCSWWDLLTVKGTCTDLEKEYLRLTSVSSFYLCADSSLRL